MWKKLALAFALGLAVPAGIYAVTVPNTFANSTVADATKVNQNFSTLAGSVTTLETTVGGLPALASNPGTGTGYIRLGDVQIAWGQATLTGTLHTRSFNFTYPAPFIEVPAVTTGIHATSSGYAYAVYNHSMSATDYSGSIVEIQYQNSSTPVRMQYTAIGRWR